MQCGLALQDFLVANYGHLRRRLHRLLGCHEQASECLHDAWLRLADIDICTPVQNPEAYVYRVACNVAMDRLRRDRSWQYAGDAEAELESVADRKPGPDEVAEARSNLQAFERALALLPQRHRTVLVALRIDEMSRPEVAARNGISLRTVDTTLNQALAYCAEHSGQQVFTGVSGPRRALRHRVVAA
ncbi:RNA polymerase sigma factor CnrH [Variovorax boronicumulans]|nr:RNA polymerase sigma factor CnrH [Variovorax boronicumulans]